MPPKPFDSSEVLWILNLWKIMCINVIYNLAGHCTGGDPLSRTHWISLQGLDEICTDYNSNYVHFSDHSEKFGFSNNQLLFSYFILIHVLILLISVLNC